METEQNRMPMHQVPGDYQGHRIEEKQRKIFERAQSNEPFQAMKETEKEREQVVSAFSRDATRLRSVIASGRMENATSGQAQTRVSSSNHRPQQNTLVSRLERSEVRRDQDAGREEEKKPVEISEAALKIEDRGGQKYRLEVEQGRDSSNTLERKDEGGVEKKESTQPKHVRIDPTQLSLQYLSEHYSPGPDVDHTRDLLRTGNPWKTISLVLTVGAGILIAIGLYAGGGELLTGLFSNSNESITPVNPAAITERPKVNAQEWQANEASVGVRVGSESEDPSEESAMKSSAGPQISSLATGNIQEVEKRAEETTKGNKVQGEETVDRVIAKGQEIKKPDRDVRERMAEKQKPIAEADTRKEKSARSEKAKQKEVATSAPKPTVKSIAKNDEAVFNVQVRATSDEKEANRIARKLKRSGLDNITILQTEKNGKPFYRIRFGTYTSKTEAAKAAKETGYSQTWVTQQ